MNNKYKIKKDPFRKIKYFLCKFTLIKKQKKKNSHLFAKK